MRDRKDLFRGSLIGGAIGDALGYAIEFNSWKEIRKRYGENGIRDFELEEGQAIISDDTQMTLFTAEGLVNGAQEFLDAFPQETEDKERCAAVQEESLCSCYLPHIWGAYKDWYLTQSWNLEKESYTGNSWLFTIPHMHSRRAPGNTCLSSLMVFAQRKEKKAGGKQERTKEPEDLHVIRPSISSPLNNSRGCGGVMRVAPVGLFFNPSETTQEVVDRIGAEAAALTHGNPLAWLPSAMLVHIVGRLVYGETAKALGKAGTGGSSEGAGGKMPRAVLEEAVRDAASHIGKQFGHVPATQDFLELMRSAVELSAGGLDDRTAIKKLGEGWTGHEALAIAVFAALRYGDDFRRAIQCAVNHEGDSDSTGSVAGNILGALYGYEAIKGAFATGQLELRDEILRMSDQLYEASLRAGEI